MTTLLKKEDKHFTLPGDSRKILSIEPGLEMYFASIDPDTAIELLDTTIGNRQLNKSHREEIADAMKRGSYKDYIYDPIRITSDGLLADGHHRLSALVDTGTTHNMLVITGYSHNDFMWMDQNSKRTTKNTFQVLGLRYPAERAAAVTFIERLMRFEVGKRSMSMNDRISPSNEDAIYVNKLFPNVIMEEKILFYNKYIAKEFALPRGATIALSLLHHSINSELCRDFWDGFVLGKDNALVTTGDPRGALREKLKVEQQRLEKVKLLASGRTRDGGWNPIDVAVWIHYTYMKFVERKKLKQIIMRDDLHEQTLDVIHATARSKWLVDLRELGYVRIQS